MPFILYTMLSLILYAPKQITHVQTVISEHDRNGAKWEVGHIAIYLTKRDGGGELRLGVCRGSGRREGFWKHRSDSVCLRELLHTFDLEVKFTSCYGSLKKCLVSMDSYC